MRYKNPWDDAPGFINLGEYTPPVGIGEKSITFDLYAFVVPNGVYEVDLGARYSNDGPDYVSGGVYDSHISGSLPIVMAAARYYQQLVAKGDNQ